MKTNLKRYFLITFLALLAVSHWACQQTYSVAPLAANSAAVNNATLGWTASTSSASFGPRTAHTSVVFNNKMWVIGGIQISGGTVNNIYNDVWYSTDGANWTQATANAGFTPRYFHSSVVFNNAMWVIGGGFGGSYGSDVWSSTDGVTWNPVTLTAAFGPREGHACVVYNGKIWLIGGYNNSYLNDVWYSTDGAHWTLATASAAFSARYAHSCLVYNSKMWVIAGGSSVLYHDAWYSTDGVNWTAATTMAPFAGRAVQSGVVFNNAMWISGGVTNLSTFASGNDSWYSSDGTNWSQATGTPFTPTRYAHTGLAYNNSMWVIAGYDYPNSIGDVWHAP